MSKIAWLIQKEYGPLVFSVFEIGAVPLSSETEPFEILLELFPGSRITAFELESKLCDELNRTAPAGKIYHPIALGVRGEERLLFETNHPMCTSLYRPNRELLLRYNAMEVSLLKSVSRVQTVSLDEFAATTSLSPDFIKIDIQGAELDVFKGGVSVLKGVLGIVSEVEFVPLYSGQPLFGDVSAYLAAQGLMFHKFINLAGRTLQPLVLNNDPTFATQLLWADAMYIRDVANIINMDDEALLKMAVLSILYGSPDVSFCALHQFDQRRLTCLHNEIFELYS